MISVVGISACTRSGGADQTLQCKNESPITSLLPASPGIVVEATSSNGSAAGLLFLKRELPIRSGDEAKIVWRVTGQGPLSLEYFDPSGKDRPLTFGPKEHLDSNFDRPGDEWGAGFQFDVSGCWHIRLSRTGTSADAWVFVQ